MMTSSGYQRLRLCAAHMLHGVQVQDVAAIVPQVLHPGLMTVHTVAAVLALLYTVQVQCLQSVQCQVQALQTQIVHGINITISHRFVVLYGRLSAADKISTFISPVGYHIGKSLYCSQLGPSIIYLKLSNWANVYHGEKDLEIFICLIWYHDLVSFG